MYSPLFPLNSLMYAGQTGIFVPIEQMGTLRLQWLTGEAIVQMSGKVKSKTLFVSGPLTVPLHSPTIPFLNSSLDFFCSMHGRPVVLATFKTWKKYGLSGPMPELAFEQHLYMIPLYIKI